MVLSQSNRIEYTMDLMEIQEAIASEYRQKTKKRLSDRIWMSLKRLEIAKGNMP